MSALHVAAMVLTMALLFLVLALFGCAGYRCAPNTERPGVTCVRR